MTNELKQAFDRYQNAELSKPAYIECMLGFHQRLFDYSDFLRFGQISNINISSEGVIFTSRSGPRFFCEAYDSRQASFEALNFGSYEGPESEMLQRALSEVSVFFDIGANIGWHSIHAAFSNPSQTVYAFEPIPETYRRLRRNIELNDLKNIVPCEYGVSNTVSLKKLFYLKRLSCAASGADLLNDPETKILEVETKTLDDIVNELNVSVDLVKIDIEGAELYALQGGSHVLSRDRPIVFCEMLRKWCRKFEYHPDDIIGLMSSHGYRCYGVDGNRLQRIDSVDEDTLATNFFFLHETQHKAFLRATLA